MSTTISNSSESEAAVDYDPFAPESMVDPRPIYEALRKSGPIHYLPKYDAWAVAGFNAAWKIARDAKNFTTMNRGMPPISALLGEPTMVNFTAMDSRDHSASRRLLQPAYNAKAADHDEEFMRGLAREVLHPLVESGDGTMDVFKDYANRVAARFAARKVGIPDVDAERIRKRSEEFFTREYGQVGTSDTNGAAGAEVFGYLQQLLSDARKAPSTATGDLAVMLDAEINGRKLTDDEILGNLFTLVVTGSETTETSVAATLYYLAQHPDQLADVRRDRSLLQNAFMEAVRYDHPTDIMCREVAHEVEVAGHTLKPGQQVIMLWGSVNRDEAEFENAHVFDIHRTYPRHLLFGFGQHRCLGEAVALRLGTVLLQEFFAVVDTFEVDWDNCERKYAEFVQGFQSVPITFTVA